MKMQSTKQKTIFGIDTRFLGRKFKNRIWFVLVLLVGHPCLALADQIFENEKYLLEQDEKALDNALSCFQCGEHVISYRANFLSHVQSAYNRYVSYFIGLSNGQNLVRSEVLSVLENHRSLWKNYNQTYSTSHIGFGGTPTSTIDYI